MYSKFQEIEKNGYRLKLQGAVSIIVIGGVLLFFSLVNLVAYIRKSDGVLLTGFIALLLFAGMIFRRYSARFQIFPKEKLIRYSSGFGDSLKEYKFDDFEEFEVHTAKSIIGLTLGNTLKMAFQNGNKSKLLLLAQNVSAETMRVITEEITQLMEKK